MKTLFTLCTLYGLLALAYGSVTFGDNGGITIIVPTIGYLLLSIALLGVVSYFYTNRQPQNLQGSAARLELLPWWFVAALPLIVFTDVTARHFTFFLGTSNRSEIVLLGLIALMFAYLFRSRVSSNERLFSWPLLLICQVLLSAVFLNYANGRFIFSDDHPSFFYRLHLLKEHFPYIPFYNTDWVAGYLARDFYPVGVLNIFILTAPLLYTAADILGKDWSPLYTIFLPYLFIFIVPWSIYAASRLLKLSAEAATVAAILALTPSISFFEWLLKHGTVAFCLSAGLFPLTLALTFRLVLDEEKPRWIHVLLLTIVSTLCLTWTFSVVAFIPFIAIALIRFKSIWEKERCVKVGVFLLLYLVLNGPWLLFFASQYDLGRFFSPPGTHTGHDAGALLKAEIAGSAYLPGLTESHSQSEPTNSLFSSVWKSLDKLKEELIKINPLVLLLFIPAIPLLPNRTLRLVIFSTALWLVFIPFVGEMVKPHLQLRRMLIHASFMMAICSGNLFVSLLRESLERLRQHSAARKITGALGFSVLSGMALFSIYAASATLLNRSDQKFLFASPIVKDLSAAIHKYGGDGRTFVLSFILHELNATSYDAENGGHIAPLPVFSGKPMFASSYVHRVWRAVDPIPKSFRERDQAGIEEFLDLVNTTAVVAFRREWITYCRNNPRYKEVFREGSFHLFTRVGPTNGYFLKGSGEILTDGRELTVIPHETELILKFRSIPHLKHSGGDDVTLFAVPAYIEDLPDDKQAPVDFIGLHVPQHYVDEQRRVAIGIFAQ